MLKEIHTVPVTSTWLWYGIGSRNELPEKTGLSHWVEHMQFKGTHKFTGDDIDSLVARVGGYANAFTSPDWTTYFETMPSAHLHATLELEADRMINSLFDPEDVETERTVIISEREGSENYPEFRLDEAVQMHAFQQHPYRNEVLGSKEDLLGITRDDLYKHYRKHYQPSNAILCIAGDISPNSVLEEVENLFGGIPSSPLSKSIPTPEKSLNPGNQLELEGPGEAHYLEIAWRCPAARDPDFFAYTIIESLLSGPSSLNMFGSGDINNRTSRLYQALVEEDFAASVFGDLSANIDPGVYKIFATIRPDGDPWAALKIINEQIRQITAHELSQREIDRAIKQASALFAYGSDNITNQGFWMGYSSSFADYQWVAEYLTRLRSVSPSQVLRTAQNYLREDQRVVGIYRATKTQGDL
ncbi:MAG TPA: pitrilysin family protein [Anaerolineaceae bacterium]|nr:pitrilysin family protein [Anaerolineaceae bacterium]